MNARYDGNLLNNNECSTRWKRGNMDRAYTYQVVAGPYPPLSTLLSLWPQNRVFHIHIGGSSWVTGHVNKNLTFVLNFRWLVNSNISEAFVVVDINRKKNRFILLFHKFLQKIQWMLHVIVCWTCLHICVYAKISAALL